MSHFTVRRMPRRGQAAVEFALSIGLVITLLLGFFDLARGLAAYASVSEMAWAGARFAASGACLTHPRDEPPPESGGGQVSGGATPACPAGSDPSTPPNGTLSPAQQDAITAQARGAAFAIDPSAPTISIQLPDGGSRLGQRVRVAVSYAYVPISSQFVGGRAVIQLSGSQTLLIGR
ncbi:MAG TPA: TadE family protein [Chloroflexota bacterium]